MNELENEMIAAAFIPGRTTPFMYAVDIHIRSGKVYQEISTV